MMKHGTQLLPLARWAHRRPCRPRFPIKAEILGPAARGIHAQLRLQTPTQLGAAVPRLRPCGLNPTVPAATRGRSSHSPVRGAAAAPPAAAPLRSACEGQERRPAAWRRRAVVLLPAAPSQRARRRRRREACAQRASARRCLRAREGAHLSPSPRPLLGRGPPEAAPAPSPAPGAAVARRRQLLDDVELQVVFVVVELSSSRGMGSTQNMTRVEGATRQSGWTVTTQARG